MADNGSREKQLWAALDRCELLLQRSSAQTADTSATAVGQPQEMDLRTWFAFTPHQRVAELAHDSGRYSLSAEPQGYLYIPPRRPDALGDQIAELKARPQFSIVVPVFNTPLDVFRSMIACVQSQWYPYWELILVDDCSTTLDVAAATRSIAGADSRVRLISLRKNQGISRATNAGLAEACGDYIVFLDHDDELTVDCLFELAKVIDRDDPDYLYSDEDRIDRSGRFVGPFFKPDWSPDTFMSTMYTCHVLCVRRELLLRVGFLRKEFDGAQDWDLVLRITEKAKKISHIPKVLYHWRAIPGSAADTLDVKPYAIDAGRRAREDALRRRGLRGTLEPGKNLPQFFRTVYAIQGSPKVSIIIPSKNNTEILKRCIESIFEYTRYRRFEIIILDNGSTEVSTLSYLDELRRKEQMSVVRDASKFNWSALNNRGAQHCTGEILLFLNDDTEVLTQEWLEEMIGYAQLNHIAAVGAKLLYPPGDLIQHNGIVNVYDGPVHTSYRQPRNDGGWFGRNSLEFNCIAVQGACLMVERKKFDRLKGFDEEFAVAYNDVDFGFRAIKAGWYNVVCQGAELIHHESLTRGSDHADAAKFRRLTSERNRLYRAHPEFFLHDPFHNPNLHPNDPCYGLPQ